MIPEKISGKMWAAKGGSLKTTEGKRSIKSAKPEKNGIYK